MSSPAIVLLQDGECRLSVCPALGGTIVRFTWRGRDILRPAPAAALLGGLARQMSCYPLVPYSNRIGHADLIVEGGRFSLRANASPEPHAMHGVGWQRAWTVQDQTGHLVELALRHEPDVDWPFAFEASEKLQVMQDTLLLRLSVRNEDDRPMPAGLGLHPYFPYDADTRLKCDWTGMWQMGADSLPTEQVQVPPEADFRHANAIAGWRVDNCFTGWNGQATIEYPTHRAQLNAEGCRQLVCFATGGERGFIALEPVTHVNNAFALAARGVTGTGMRILAPGETFEISLSIQVAAR